MKTIVFNNKEYQCPERWQDVSVGMLIKSDELAGIYTNAPILAIIHAYTGIPLNELRLKKKDEVNAVVAELEFISTPYKPTPTTTFMLDNDTYSCEDDLLQENFEDWVSQQTVLYNYRDNMVLALPRLLAITCKKAGETLSDFDLDERTQLFYNLPMTTARNVEAFFLHSLNAYKGLSLLYSRENVMEELVLGKVRELQNTMQKHREHIGISWLMKLRIGIYIIYLKHLKRVLVRFYNSKPTKSSKKNWIQTFKKLFTGKVRIRNKS